MNPKEMLSENLHNVVCTIKNAILQSQLRAVKAVNAEQLSLYYGIGQYVSANSRKGFWGTGAIETISEQLQKELPGLRGFSATSIKKMRNFYEEWHDVLSKSTAAAVNLETTNKSPTADSEIDTKALFVDNPTATAVNFNLNDFLSLGFSHHIEIINKTTSPAERIYYIHQAVQNSWSKYTLRTQLEADVYHRQGTLPNNFTKTISDARSALKAIDMFKDEYLLDYINVEELGERDKDDIDERVIEQAIIHNIKKFIMTFGRDFTFVGNQYHLEAFGIDHFSDLLFFNRELNALVCVELKRGEFKPSYLGQLTTYLRLLDDQVRKPHENPSIGIILCKSANKEYVEYVIQDYEKPMGVATYRTLNDMPEKLRKALPDMEELKKMI